jgi:hypothetical protein
MPYRAIKTIDAVHKFADSALKRDYQTQLSEPLSLLEMYDNLVKKYNNRFNSIINLLFEIEDIKLEDGNWFDHDYVKEGGQADPVIYESTFSFYLDHIPYHKDGNVIRRPMSPIFDTFEVPLGYLFLEMGVIVKGYVDNVVKYYTELFHKMSEKRVKKEKRSEFELLMFDSIRKKVSNDEFKFLLKKMRLTKKLKDQLLGC